MLGADIGLKPAAPRRSAVALPPGFGWDSDRFPLQVHPSGSANLAPRDLVDPLIWSGVAYHVDGQNGDDGNSGLGAQDGDFSDAKRSIYAAFLAGNAAGLPFRVLVQPGDYEESAFTRNGNDEPAYPVAVLGWGGQVRYRAGPSAVNWTDAGATSTTTLSAVRRVFSTTTLTAEGLYTELTKAADLAACQATLNSWYDDNGTVHVNTGQLPGPNDIALIRSFHGARFLSHSDDLYLENISCEGGITGALHCDPVCDRNIVAVNCTFRYSAPSNVNAPLHAVQIRRTNGLVAFFDCDASAGARDGWSFHEDGHAGMHVLTQGCTGYRNGTPGATSVNAFTTHDGVRSVDLRGTYGYSENGTDVHCIQSTDSWFFGTHVTARDSDGTSTAFKCSNTARMWLQNTFADAAGAASNVAVEANGGSVARRNHTAISGTEVTSGTGSISAF